MTRRALLAMIASDPLHGAGEPDVVIPVRIILDSRLGGSTLVERVWKPVWTETLRDLRRGGMHVQTGSGAGEVKRTASGSPVFTGLVHGVVNVVVTHRMPVNWDRGRGVTAVATRFEGHHVVLIALDRAHGHQIPFLSVNTCLHELIHVLLQDVYDNRPAGLEGEAREFRVDAYATRLWLFGDGSALRNAARGYIVRSRQVPVSSIGWRFQYVRERHAHSIGPKRKYRSQIGLTIICTIQMPATT
jgi:hypothetical protein